MNGSIKKSRRVIRLLKIPAPRPRSRDLDREAVRKHRAVGAIEPIEGDAVFAVDLLGRVDGERSRSDFVFALSAVPAGKLSARCKYCPPPASRAICCCNRLKAARMPPPVRRRVLCKTDYVLVREYQDAIRLQHAISAGAATCSRSSLVVHLRLWRRNGARILDRSSRPTMMRTPFDTADPGRGE